MKFNRQLLALSIITVALCSSVHADPPANTDLPTVFCFRVTDMERVAGDRNRFASVVRDSTVCRIDVRGEVAALTGDDILIRVDW